MKRIMKLNRSQHEILPVHSIEKDKLNAIDKLGKRKSFITVPLITIITFFLLSSFAVIAYLQNRDISSPNNIDSHSSEQLGPQDASVTETTPAVHINSADYIIPQMKISESASSPDYGKIVILLQQSPVDGRNQIARLAAIDNGWAMWSKASADITIYASIRELQSNHSPQFQNIHVIDIKDGIDNETIETQNFGSSRNDLPLENMIHSFSYLALCNPTAHTMRWLIFANDHTFIIPPNLRCFLNSWDAEVPVYSGNKLIRGPHRGFPLFFASGGAGAIVSHTGLKLFLLCLVLADDKYISTFLSTQPCLLKNQFKQMSSFADSLATLLESRSQGKSLHGMRVDLSSKRWAIIQQEVHRISTGTEVSLSIYDLTDPILPILKVSSKRILDCSPKSAWERSNPGLVLAYCLQAVFSAPFPLTNETANGWPEGERLNVYGVVRTLTGDVDSWYKESKLMLASGSAGANQQASPFMTTIAKDVISFHYVSQVESALLYRLLSDSTAISSQSMPRREVISSERLLQLWPSNQQDVGHYSSKLKSLDEAAKLRSFFQNVAVLDHTCPRGPSN